MNQTYEQRISTLWLVVLFGLVTHTLVEFLPLFFKDTIVADGVDIAQLSTANWMVTVMMTLPLLLVTLINLTNAKWLRYLCLVIAGLFLLLNASHPMELFEAEKIAYHQLLIMLITLFANIVLVLSCWKWTKQ